MRQTVRIGTFADDRPRGASCSPCTNVVGLARTLLALGTFCTLLFNDADTLFRPLGVELGMASTQVPMLRLSLFSIFSGSDLHLGRWIALGLLALVASGWCPRFTGIAHWWVSASLAASGVIVDGGDQVAAVLTLLLVPVTLCDGRRWHWSPAPAPAGGAAAEGQTLVARSAILVVRIQIALIYFFACVEKLRVEEWRNGTALYYWLSHPVFGAPGADNTLVPLLAHPAVVTPLTWGVLALEALLFAGLGLDRRRRPLLLGAGLLFHAGIAVLHGLFSFALAMGAALLIYLRPAEQPLRWPAPGAGRLLARCRRRLADLAARSKPSFSRTPALR